MTHTPTPWRAEKGSYYILGKNHSKESCQYIADCSGLDNPDGDRSFIVKAVNCHDDLLAALQAVVSVSDRKTKEYDMAHAAIKRARGEK